jgi:NAD(P)-dependent dehydrogenase (short-subunit alcohol dehydrogenase family)
VFINSSVFVRVGQGVEAYTAGKHAWLALAEVLRTEVDRDGVPVSSVVTGNTSTPMQTSVPPRRRWGGVAL